ncbi:helicase-related protein [Syntrophotalea acetylenica]|uniref:helicase-related protein n=1 Tax=Syntrophotalea acetylenica TaxID=29542 RepID=UPI002A365667|nr:helicase-related protein [Syntrophotalea acetylenica]MDY0262713.1 helicase-related protein [Syntrophotalea acetylenica]
MLKLEDIRKDAQIRGIEGDEIVRVITVEPVGDNALTIYYKNSQGQLGEQMLFRSDEGRLSLATAGRPWSFDAPGADFKLGLEAHRINLAHLFDPMMAIHTSNVEPLPHQISAVYEAMLPRQPLRYVLADDPGAGKTIMAGLFIREMLMRADAKRVLIVAPGGLVEQWQDELYEKFGLDFDIFSREVDQTSRTGNAFEEKDLLIARLDQLSRNEDFQEKLRATEWDLIVVDEAHKLSANYFGNKVNKTKRFLLGELLGQITRHFLLMTATPHNGKQEDFQLFMSLLDSDRFYGKFRDGAHKVDVSDMMRRMVKEDLLKFDGTPLFPERKAYTVHYELSDLEAKLYADVTDYVREEMNRADLLEGKRKGTVGFALTQLQRRLASSPEAIYKSLQRRRKRLESRMEEEKLVQRGHHVAETLEKYGNNDAPDDLDEASEEMSAEQYEAWADKVVDQATASRTIEELALEIGALKRLEDQARQVVLSGQDRKWEELSRLLQDQPEMLTPAGSRRKLILFTEHKDTLYYLQTRIGNLLGNDEAVVTIHGGTNRDARRRIQEEFRNNPDILILVATDAAGEGVNLQNANLMMNYDLPWNPNRIEQRFGRIHRIGQTEVCHLWNLVALGTREGEVFNKLFEKLEVERNALGGRVFDILGEAFENVSLKDLLIEAIRYGESQEVRAKLQQVIEGALDTGHLKAILDRSALCEEHMSMEQLFAVKEEMEKAEARKLQPYFIRAFFSEAFKLLGGELRAREAGRYEIRHVPAVIRERDRVVGETRTPVLKKYERICFEKEHIRLLHKPMADLVHPGHPLMHAATDLVLEANRSKLKQGAILVDPADDTTEPKVLFMIDHSVREASGSNPRNVSRRLQFVTIDQHGQASNSGWAPHLDLIPIDSVDQKLAADVLMAPWLKSNLEILALEYASQKLVPDHYDEIRCRRERHIDKILMAVNERLIKEINHWSDRYIKLSEDVAAGKQPRLQPENARRRVEELTARLEQRRKELEAMRNVVSSTPVVIGGALVIPQGLLAHRKGEATFCADAAARSRIENIAMDAVMAAERGLGHEVFDVSAEKCGWDVTARPPLKNGKLLDDRHIEVKGRAKGQTTITVSRNEIIYGLNQADKFLLAIVLVDEDGKVSGPHYVLNPFNQEPDFGVASINYELKDLLSRAVSPEGTVHI